MSEKYLIFGATGSIGSSLAELLKNSGNDIHLVARNENEVKNISDSKGYTFTVADVLEDKFIEKVKLKLLKLKIIEMRSIILFLPFQTYVRKQSIY